MQQVRVPDLKHPPVPKEEPFVLNTAMFKASDSPSSWVNLSALLTAYGVQCSRGDHLSIDTMTTRLPVNRLWVLVLGIVGRHAVRTDMESRGSSTETLRRQRSELRSTWSFWNGPYLRCRPRQDPFVAFTTNRCCFGELLNRNTRCDSCLPSECAALGLP